MNLHIVILAAGRGKRMCSKYPKVLHPFAGVPILERILQTVQKLNPKEIHVVYGNGNNAIPDALKNYKISWCHQTEQLGTAHALDQALPRTPDTDQILVLVGDAPIIRAETLKKLLNSTPPNQLGLITTLSNNPTGMGRIIRGADGQLLRIVEEKEATPEEKQIHEINTGVIIGSAAQFKRLIPQLNNQNSQGEYYLTDVINIARQEGQTICSTIAEEPEEMMGVNDRLQLAYLERYYQRKTAEQFMRQSVSFADPTRFDLRGTLQVGEDVTIDIDVILEGNVTIGSNCKIGPFTYLKNVTLGDNVEIRSHCVIEDAVINNGCIVGPYSRLRPGAKLLENAHIGNFVEIKNSTIGEGTKVPHLSYVGDSILGKEVNVGAGTITCNFDGASKYPTTIHDHAFIGSGTQLIAPVVIGKNAVIGAGSTITKDAPPDSLTLSRAEQISVKGWKRKIKKKGD